MGVKRTALRRGPPRGRYATSAQKRAVLERDGWACQYCGRPLEYADAVVDHVIPWAKGGTTTIDNLVASCHADNKRKGNGPAPAFYNGA